MDYSEKDQERCKFERFAITISLLAAVLLWLVATVAVDVCSMDPSSFSGCMEITRTTSWPLPSGAFEECRNDELRCRNDELRAVCLTSYELRAGCVTSFALLHLCQAAVVLAAACVAIGATMCATGHAESRRERRQGATTGWSTIRRDSTDDHMAPLPSRDSVSLDTASCVSTHRDLLPRTAIKVVSFPNETVLSSVAEPAVISRDSFSSDWGSHGEESREEGSRNSIEELLPV